MAVTTAIEWLAAADGIGHAQPRHGRDRTACGLPRIDPRWAHGIRVRHDTCLERVGITVRDPRDVAPGEQTEMFGR